MHAEMAIAFCLKGVDLVEIVFDLCLRTKMFTCGFDMIFPISTVYTQCIHHPSSRDVLQSGKILRLEIVCSDTILQLILGVSHVRVNFPTLLYFTVLHLSTSATHTVGDLC